MGNDLNAETVYALLEPAWLRLPSSHIILVLRDGLVSYVQFLLSIQFKVSISTPSVEVTIPNHPILPQI